MQFSALSLDVVLYLQLVMFVSLEQETLVMSSKLFPRAMECRSVQNNAKPKERNGKMGPWQKKLE